MTPRALRVCELRICGKENCNSSHLDGGPNLGESPECEGLLESDQTPEPSLPLERGHRVGSEASPG